MKRILIIDDEDQSDEINRLEIKAKQKGIQIKCEQFNVGSTELTDVLTNNRIDLNKVKNYFENEIDRQHLICFDYYLAPDEVTVTGVDVLTMIKPLASRSKFLFYSSLLSNIIKDILDEYKKGNGTFDEVKKKIITLVRCRVEDFVDRTSFADKIIEILSAEKIESLDDMFEQEMEKYPDYRSEYFDGIEISSLIHLLNQRDGKSQKFKKEIVEQLVAYIINLKDEDE